MSDVTICKTCFCCGRGMIPINGEFVCDDCLSLTETRDEVIRLTARLAAAEALLKEAVEYDEVELPDDWYARAAKLCGLRVITGNVAKAGGCDE